MDQNALEEQGLRSLAEGMGRIRISILDSLSSAESPAEIMAELDRLLDLEKLLYEHALETLREQGRFPFRAFFRAAGSEFSREIMTLHSNWRRARSPTEADDGT